MICDERTCAGCRYLERDDERNEPATSLAEFLADCQHAKCKVVRLVRQQISKLQNMQYERLLTAGAEVRIGTREEMQKDATYHMRSHEVLYSEVYEAHDDMDEPPDDEYEKAEGKTEQTHDEQTHTGEPYETQKATAIATRRTVEATASAAQQAARFEDTVETARAASPGRAVDRKLMLWLLDCVRHRAHLILAAAILGMIAWTALVYGVFLGATACGSGRGCYASSLRYTHAKRSLF